MTVMRPLVFAIVAVSACSLVILLKSKRRSVQQREVTTRRESEDMVNEGAPAG